MAGSQVQADYLDVGLPGCLGRRRTPAASSAGPRAGSRTARSRPPTCARGRGRCRGSRSRTGSPRSRMAATPMTRRTSRRSPIAATAARPWPAGADVGRAADAAQQTCRRAYRPEQCLCGRRAAGRGGASRRSSTVRRRLRRPSRTPRTTPRSPTTRARLSTSPWSSSRSPTARNAQGQALFADGARSGRGRPGGPWRRCCRPARPRQRSSSPTLVRRPRSSLDADHRSTRRCLGQVCSVRSPSSGSGDNLDRALRRRWSACSTRRSCAVRRRRLASLSPLDRRGALGAGLAVLRAAAARGRCRCCCRPVHVLGAALLLVGVGLVAVGAAGCSGGVGGVLRRACACSRRRSLRLGEFVGVILLVLQVAAARVRT